MHRRERRVRRFADLSLSGVQDAPERCTEAVMIGRTLHHYIIEEQLGRGAMGIVYRARDTKLGRTVAIKVLGGEGDSTAKARLLREAQMASALNHANICTIHEVGEVDGEVFVVMEHVEGRTLEKLISRGGLPVATTIQYGLRLADALAHAHKHGIVHRDLKSSNVMLSADGQPKLLDFGIGKRLPTAAESSVTRTEAGLTDSLTIAGTLAYMAPEVLQGELVDERSDVWSLGVLLYEMANGALPFEGKSGFELSAAILREPPRPMVSTVPPSLLTIILRALSKDPAQRYQQAAEIRASLEAVTPGAIVSAHRRSMPLMAVGLLVLLTAAYTLWNTAARRNSAVSRDVAVAILPFHALDASDELRVLGLGIPDSIITKLANVRGMRVRPTSAILRFQSGPVDIRDAGRALMSDYVLTGTVQHAGERYAVNVQLVRVSDAEPLWGNGYNLTSSDLLSVQDRIAEQVAGALQIRMSATERERLYRRYTDNYPAYQMYLRGRSHLLRQTKDDTLKAVSAFENALTLDSDYALARAGLAMASAQMRLRFAEASEVRQWEERAKTEARHALDIHPELAEAHEALAAVHRNTEFDWDLTIAESRLALALNPSLDQPHNYLAAAFLHLGLMEEAQREARAAVELNPANRVEPLRLLGTTALFDGRSAQAITLLEDARRLSGSVTSDWYLAQAYYYQGRRSEAEAMLAALRGSAQVEQRAGATLASFRAAKGEKAAAESLIRKVTSSGYMDHHVAYSVGVTYAQLARPQEAERWLNQAIGSGFHCYPWFQADPLLQPLRDKPEFVRLMLELRRGWEAAQAKYR